MEHDIPLKIHDAIRQEVNAKNFLLLDLEGLAAPAINLLFNDATYSRDTDLVLIGWTSAG